ncbi:hypothetical protein HPB49_012366 [Dermacentor silvarum]|uniref:Uncharacterized protein n=1 Tax=Dermacentor silvarum TaxID=543639 RepID=A0ACB8E015_DERSI|nr:hypothetical protein HPB49_012366 [Dermacentor silvarum]
MSVVFTFKLQSGDPDVNMTEPSNKAAHKALGSPYRRECTRLQQLLTSEELGNRCPSQILYWMRQLLGEGNFNTHSALLKELFLQHLTQPVRLVLAAADDTTLDHLAELDDKIHEAAAPSVCIIATAPEPSVVTQLDGCI